MELGDVLLTEIAERSDPGPRSNRPIWLGVVARLCADHGGERYVGGSAVTLPPGARSPWNAPDLEREMSRAVRDLIGSSLTAAEDPLAVAHGIAGSIERSVSGSVGDAAFARWQRTAVAGVAGAVEAGTLNLLAQARGEDLAGLLGARREIPQRTARTLTARGDVEELRQQVTAQHGRYPVTRLTGQGNPEYDLETVAAVEQANVEAGHSTPVWLECSGRYAPHDAEQLVDELGQMLASGRLTSRVYIEQPIPRSRRSELAELTRRAYDLTCRSDANDTPDLRIILDESVVTPEELDYFGANGIVTGVSVDTRRGVSAAMRIVERAVEYNPDATIVLSGSRQSTDLERAVIEAMARALPKLDFYLPGRTTVHLAGDGSRTSPSLDRLVTWMGRGIWERTSPAPDPWPAHTRHNEYDATGLEPLGKNSLDSYLLENAARQLGLATVRSRGVDFHVEDRGGNAVGFHCTTGPATSRYVAKVCDDKQITRSLLARAGVTVPQGRSFAAADWTGARDFARSLGWPVVVKPVDGKGGSGVTTGIDDPGELRRAFSALAAQGRQQIIVETHLRGADYRFFVVGTEVVSVVQRTASSVVGDGRSTVAELMIAKNLARLRNPHLRSRLLSLGDEELHLLDRQDTTPDSIPGTGERVMLSTAGNIARGGDSVEVLDGTHPSLRELAVRAVAAVPGLHHAGVDILAEDHRLPLDQQDAGVCELNALPAITTHHYPAIGPPRAVSRALLEYTAESYGLITSRQPDTVSVAMRITGTVQGVGYRQWFGGIARELGLSGWVRNAANPDVVEAGVTGACGLVSALAVQAIFGPAKAQPELVETHVVDERHAGEFQAE
ncbi:hypothetical protein EF847_03590 [Actinobacteria bacterium YIM 96077]|uniref:acylphosphatase n=1 Tax=Phytoactinopolyspora halophila TaxID=1981511 RepID=A0A329R6Z4_9ACTN|nr:acylphosphatase [Phytoactinopolyspora halophila]AYY11928.1 hypothetical protein EF847_03590 [Actinobacteria bacterium YIM 96077]RAW18838.1 hypothetical protein DPM12_01920 [Phytoactinopolyspora halophila]